MTMMASPILLLIKVVFVAAMGAAALPRVIPDTGDLLSSTPELITFISGSSKRDTHCFSIFITDGYTSHQTVYKMGHQQTPWAMVMMEVGRTNQHTNVTQSQMSWVVSQARWLRKLSWCVTVVVVSDDPAFLTTFAEGSLKGRLLVWSTKLLVVTSLPREGLRDLLADHWTFSMNNAMLINVAQPKQSK